MIRLAVASALFIAGLGAVAHSADCAVPGDLDAQAAAIAAKPTCKTAAALARDCAYGASGDVSLQNAVVKVCEMDFVPTLTPAALTAYRVKVMHCRGKYANRQGTLYVSMAAMCEGELAQAYSRRARAAGQPTARP